MYYVSYEYLDPSDEYFEWIDCEEPCESAADAALFASKLTRDAGYCSVCISTESRYSNQRSRRTA